MNGRPPYQVDGNRKNKQCNCKNSRCLKLYCECFASGVYCNPNCNCTNCCNNEVQDTVRKEAIETILERNPDAFRPKIQEGAAGKHNKGCACKRSFCLKRYCECYQAGILCSDNCKCNDCKNFKESDDRKALLSTDTHGPMPGMPLNKKMRVGDSPGIYSNVDTPVGPITAPPMPIQQPMVPLPLIVQIVNQNLVESVCQQMVSAAFRPTGSAMQVSAGFTPALAGAVSSGLASQATTSGVMPPAGLMSVAASTAGPLSGMQNTHVPASQEPLVIQGTINMGGCTAVASDVASTVDKLPTLSTAGVPKVAQADALVCHENMGLSPSPEAKPILAAPPSELAAVVKQEAELDAEGIPLQPSSWYVNREKVVLLEFQKFLGQLSGAMREKLAEREARRQAMVAQIGPRAGVTGTMVGSMPVMPGSIPVGIVGGAGMPGHGVLGGMPAGTLPSNLPGFMPMPSRTGPMPYVGRSMAPASAVPVMSTPMPDSVAVSFSRGIPVSAVPSQLGGSAAPDSTTLQPAGAAAIHSHDALSGLATLASGSAGRSASTAAPKDA